MSICGSWLHAFAAVAIPTLVAQVPPDQVDGNSSLRLKYETGRVTVRGDVQPGGIATIDLPPGWRYLQAIGARTVVEQVWGNRPNPATLGLLLPPTPWGGLIVSYDARGYVADDDIDQLDPRGMLKDLRLSVEAGNPARKRAGQPSVTLADWAQPPQYDAKAHKLSWGRVLHVEGVAQPTVNYDVRVLSADGLLVLQAVADAPDLERVVADAQQVLARIELAPGKRYTDHDPVRHLRANHGLRALVSPRTRAAVPAPRLLVKPALVAIVIAVAMFLRRRRRAADAI